MADDARQSVIQTYIMTTLGERIKKARVAKGLSQPELARRCGWESQSRISHYETGKREPQLADLQKIARGLGLQIEELVSEGHPEKFITPYRQNESKSGIGSEEGRPVVRYRMAPIVGTAQLGPDGFWEELGYPVGYGDGYLDVPTSDPAAYALRVKGDSMAPAIRDGWYVVVEPNEPVSPGEYVVVVTLDGRSMVKELLWERSEQIALMSVADGYGRLTLDRSEIKHIHHVAFIAPPSKRKLYSS